MKRDEILFIRDILDSIEAIEEFSEGITRDELISNRMKRSAIVREIEIIGEAVKNISEITKGKYSDVEWKKIAGSRDIIIHAYFGIDIEKVWNVIKEELPNLKKKIKKILEDYLSAK